MERIMLCRKIDMPADVLGKRGIDLVEHILPVEK
jgi:hypothetical protein